MPAAAMLNTPDREEVLDQIGADPGEGEVAEHHARDAGQHLQDRLEDPPDPRTGVLGEVDGRPQAEWGGDEHGDDGDQQRRHDDRPDVEQAASRKPSDRPERAHSTDRMKFHASPTSENTMSRLRTTEKAAAPKNKRRTLRSLRWRRGSPRRSTPSAALDAVVVPPRFLRAAGDAPVLSRSALPLPGRSQRSPPLQAHAPGEGVNVGRAADCGTGFAVVVELDVAGFGHRGDTFVREIELHEGGQLRLLHQLGLVDVDEERSRERVLEAGDGLGGRGHAAVAAVDLDGLEASLLLDVEGVADPPEGRVGALDALDDHVVVRRCDVVGPGYGVLARSSANGAMTNSTNVS